MTPSVIAAVLAAAILAGTGFLLRPRTVQTPVEIEWVDADVLLAPIIEARLAGQPVYLLVPPEDWRKVRSEIRAEGRGDHVIVLASDAPGPGNAILTFEGADVLQSAFRPLSSRDGDL